MAGDCGRPPETWTMIFRPSTPASWLIVVIIASNVNFRSFSMDCAYCRTRPVAWSAEVESSIARMMSRRSDSSCDPSADSSSICLRMSERSRPSFVNFRRTLSERLNVTIMPSTSPLMLSCTNVSTFRRMRFRSNGVMWRLSMKEDDARARAAGGRRQSRRGRERPARQVPSGRRRKRPCSTAVKFETGARPSSMTVKSSFLRPVTRLPFASSRRRRGSSRTRLRAR